jgi:hypothetical protein
VGAVEIAARSEGVEPICLRWEDTDDDGEAEWVGLYLRPTEPPRLKGFVLDGDTWHELTAPKEERHGLGQYPACELAVDDLNIDGKSEILVLGHAEQGIDVLHAFVWREARYELLASFQGDAGVRVEDVQGDFAEEIVVRNRAGRDLAWETIHAWDGTTYGWVWERYKWLYADRPHSYLTDSPTHAVISFYLAVDDRDLPGAYGLLSAASRASQPYRAWAAGFHTTLSAEVGAVHQVERVGDRATVAAQVRSYDNLDGYIVGRLWDVTWTVVWESEHWRLDASADAELDRWEAPYLR